ncbi:hypothetical protein L484_022670 [Morus notabilis]|uniref:Uncharacterized protein n=1 Tax=Morus notabilis TaxID=981085 RepID=W9R5R4_9ROSA|nr:hypothetical protein L484_022670 [Morus notabilis]
MAKERQRPADNFVEEIVAASRRGYTVDIHLYTGQPVMISASFLPLTSILPKDQQVDQIRALRGSSRTPFHPFLVQLYNVENKRSSCFRSSGGALRDGDGSILGGGELLGDGEENERSPIMERLPRTER